MFKITKKTRILGFWSLSSRDLPSGHSSWWYCSWVLNHGCFFYMKKKCFWICPSNAWQCPWPRRCTHSGSVQRKAWMTPSLPLCLSHSRLPFVAVGSLQAFGTRASESWSSCQICDDAWNGLLAVESVEISKLWEPCQGLKFSRIDVIALMRVCYVLGLFCGLSRDAVISTFSSHVINWSPPYLTKLPVLHRWKVVELGLELRCSGSIVCYFSHLL